jgi:hypothetical protein
MNTDLMGYLHEAWKKHLDEDKTQKLGIDASDAIGHFRDFCTQHLKGNPPASVFMTGYGLGIRMADGTMLSLVEAPVEEDLPAESMPVTRPKSLPGQRGITDTKSVPVFGGK